jgi:hypothetical protein
MESIQHSVHCSHATVLWQQHKFQLFALFHARNCFATSQALLTIHSKHNTVPESLQLLSLIMALGPYFDPLGETEPENTIYTLTVCCPPRPNPKWLPSFVTRTPVTYPSTGATYTIKPDNTNPNLDCFEQKHLEDMPTRVIKLKRSLFPLDVRCAHVRTKTTCDKGCYVFEKSGGISRWWCKAKGCEGHVYCGRVKEDEVGSSCFGKKGERMVCVE